MNAYTLLIATLIVLGCLWPALTQLAPLWGVH
jgi:hypothetical protein